ncbi:MFS transporter [uncultured Pseudokineococcus sp.]|uniref:MFS transporter n=1 Tax=uncultured Pseudokineococcus sp. TaxID=1642928 RepID=UPI00261949C7|nr:MFS transporter [uncultured Pseudokineococcus sp.]
MTAPAGPPVGPAVAPGRTPLGADAARRRYVALTALRWFPTGLLVPVLVLLAVDRGLSLAEVGLVAAAQGVVVLLLELPTGGLADALGRRPLLVVAGLVGTAALAVLLVAGSPAGYAAAFALMGVWRALDSGPLQSWYVDAALAADTDPRGAGSGPGGAPGGAQERVEAGVARGAVALNASVGAGALVSGGLVAAAPALGWPGAPLALPVAVALVVSAAGVLAVALLVREPPRRADGARGRRALTGAVRDVPRTVVGGLRVARRSRVLVALLAVEACWGFGMVAFETLTPPRLAEVLAGSVAAGTERAGQLMGPVSAAGWLAAAVGATAAAGLARRFGTAVVAGALRVVQGATVVGLALLAGPVGVVTAYLACYAVHGASNPLHAALLHRQATRENRTVVLSMNSMVAQPAAALGAVVLGALADGASLGAAMLVGAVVLALAAPLYLPARRQERERADVLSAARPPAPA